MVRIFVEIFKHAKCLDGIDLLLNSLFLLAFNVLLNELMHNIVSYRLEIFKIFRVSHVNEFVRRADKLAIKFIYLFVLF